MSTKYLQELKELIILHINSQGIKDKSLINLVNSVKTDDQTENSWGNLWLKKGDEYVKESRLNEALSCYIFGRFPYVYGDNRRRSHIKCIELFKRIYKVGIKDFKTKIIFHKNLKIPVYLSGEWMEGKPLLLVMGGIISIKEQWGQFLKIGKKLGYTTCLAEFPSVGQNPLIYDKDSYLYINSILDQLSQGNINLKAVLCGISFSGELMIKSAIHNKNSIGIICSGSPVSNFFSDPKWIYSVPITTIKTLKYISKTEKNESLFDKIKDFKICNDDLKKINIPIRYIACSKDNIVPPSEAQLIKNFIKDSEYLMLNDIHGGPWSMKLIKMYIYINLCKFNGKDKGILYKIIKFCFDIKTKNNKAIVI